MWGRMSPWVRQKLKRHRKSRFQIEMKLLSKAQLQIFSLKKVSVFVEAVKSAKIEHFGESVPRSGYQYRSDPN